MAVETIVASLNDEIDRLTRARDVLVGSGRGVSSGPGRVIRRRRPMSPETKKKIGEMMRKRWAERRKGKAKAA